MSESISKFEQKVSRDKISLKNEKSSGHVDLVSRRDLVKSLGAVGAVSALALSVAEVQKGRSGHTDIQEHADEQHSEQASTNEKEGQQLKSHKEKKNHSLLETFSESSLLEIGKIVAGRVYNELGYKNIPSIGSEVSILGNKSFSEKIPLILTSVCTGPFVEEILTRLIPSALIDANTTNNDKYQWGVGIPTAVLFALMHNVSDVGGQKETKLKFTSLNEFIPVPQFISGIFYWYMMREKGFNHAVLAHATQNATIISIAELLSRMYPKQGGAPA